MKQWMSLALEQARQAARQGEIPVGAVLVHEGQVICAAHNQREATHDPTAHAELLCLREGARLLGDWRLRQCTLYVTLEPCPMCAGAILNARIPKVVYGASDDKCGAVHSVCSLFDMRFNHHPEVEYGILEEECAQLLTEFFVKLRVELRTRPKWKPTQ